MRIYRCWYCSSPVYPGHGIMFVRNDCKEFRFCRGKCHKAFKKKRAPRKTKWTKTYRASMRKDLTDDFAQSFERKRNVALTYSRDKLLTTLNAINTVTGTKEKRENLFITKRLKRGIDLRKKEDLRLVETHMHLIRAPNAKEELLDEEMEKQEVDQLDVQMEDMEAEMIKQNTPKIKKIVKFQKLLVKK